MIQRYTLLQSVLGFRIAPARVAEISAGSIVTVAIGSIWGWNQIRAEFDGQTVMVAAEDIERIVTRSETHRGWGFDSAKLARVFTRFGRSA
jgi:hypothetical protein